MVLKSSLPRFSFLLLSRRLLPAMLAAAVLAAIPSTGAAADSSAADEGGNKPRPGEISLPVKDYLVLVESVERRERARADETAHREPAVAEVVAQRLAVAVDGDEARVTTELEVLVQGPSKAPISLPLSGIADQLEVRPAGRAAVGLDGSGKPVLVAPAAGRYAVRVVGRDRLASGGGVSRLALARIDAPVAVLDLDLAADLAWSCAGTVWVEESVAAGRRRLRLSAHRGEQPVLELRRRLAADQSAELRVESVALTLFRLAPEGPRRLDVVLYDVSRGALADLAVELPPGFQVEQAGTDEGPAVPVIAGSSLTVHRQRQLQGTGYLVLTSTPALQPSMPLALVRPRQAPRAHFFAAASTISADVVPQPAPSWVRVDLDDLPPELRDALAALDLAAAWRLTGGVDGLTASFSALPPAAALDTVVGWRETTTLLSVDGTLLHRDRYTLERAGAALDLVLPAGATLWSAKVGDQPVRPLVRGDVVSVPLSIATPAAPGAASATAASSSAPTPSASTTSASATAPPPPALPTVEIVSVLARALPPKGRSQLLIELPRVHAPVLEQSWNVLLPEAARYRIHASALRPVRQEAGQGSLKMVDGAPGVFPADGINVGGNQSPAAAAKTPIPAGTANIYGKVADQQGAPLPGVTVTLTRTDAHGEQVQVSNARGELCFLALAAGRYHVKAELQGFTNTEYPNVQVKAGHEASLQITLSSAVEDVITVTAESPLLDERRISTGATLSSGELGGMPSAAGHRGYEIGARRLRQGLVGGVKPLAIDIPEAGKSLLLTAILPPPRITLELDVRAHR
jgi:hypothetical protein